MGKGKKPEMQRDVCRLYLIREGHNQCQQASETLHGQWTTFEINANMLKATEFRRLIGLDVSLEMTYRVSMIALQKTEGIQSGGPKSIYIITTTNLRYTGKELHQKKSSWGSSDSFKSPWQKSGGRPRCHSKGRSLRHSCRSRSSARSFARASHQEQC